jgi:hypothetical protein
MELLWLPFYRTFADGVTGNVQEALVMSFLGLQSRITRVLGLFMLVLVAPAAVQADIMFSGSGLTGTDPLGQTWLTQSPGFQGVTSWGIPGRAQGIVEYLGTETIIGVEATFFGLPSGVTLEQAGANFGPAMNVTPFTGADNWIPVVTGNSIVFTPPTPLQTLAPGDSFFFHATFTGQIDPDTFSFQAVYRTLPRAVPEPSSVVLSALGLSALLSLGYRRLRAA